MAAIAGNGHHVGILRRHSWAKDGSSQRRSESMTKRLWTTSVLAVVVAMLFVACQSSTTSPSPSASEAAPPAASATAAASEAPSRERPRPRLRQGERCLRSRPATPSWTRHSAPTSRSTASASRSRRSGSVAKASTSTPRSRPSRRRPGSTSCRRASPRSTRWCCARASMAAPPDLAMLAQPSAVVDYGEGGKTSTSQRSWIPRS